MPPIFVECPSPNSEVFLLARTASIGYWDFSEHIFSVKEFQF